MRKRWKRQDESIVPSLDEWHSQYTQHRLEIKSERDAKKAAKKAAEAVIVDAEDDIMQGGHIIEDEDETKSSSKNKPEWKRYYHLVVVAKNQVGLGNLFTLVKKAYKDGFYRFPRIDYKMLKEHGEGLVISTACIGGRPSGLIYQEFPDTPFDKLDPCLLDDPVACKTIMNRLENMTDRFTDIVGPDNFFLELQFNNLGAQHLTNRALIELSKKTGLSLIPTADSHYASPEKWQARELYKKLGWMGSKAASQGLPEKENLKCELYPKNAQQMWDEFLVGHKKYDFYEGHEELVRDSIERTHSIAWDLCDGSWIDTKAKLPNHSDNSSTAIQKLIILVKKRLIEMGFDDKPEYVNRAKEELSDIKYLGHASYFLTMNEIFHLAEKKTLLGPGRGSAPGSLVSYVLGITQIDPLEYDLLWTRFLGRHRCLDELTNVMTENGPIAIKDIKIGDTVMTHTGQFKKVTNRSNTIHDKAIRVKFNGKTITCSPNHKWIIMRNGETVEVLACLLKMGDKLLMTNDLTQSE